MTKPQTKTLLAEALKQTRLAYQFAPGSYTYHAMATGDCCRHGDARRLDH
jgi:hypothetical protein